MKKHNVSVVKGVGGYCVYLNGFRIVGSKPWGGGLVVYEEDFSNDDMKKALSMAETVKRGRP